MARSTRDGYVRRAQAVLASRNILEQVAEAAGFLSALILEVAIDRLKVASPPPEVIYRRASCRGASGLSSAR
jgi:hypothetical protein